MLSHHTVRLTLPMAAVVIVCVVVGTAMAQGLPGRSPAPGAWLAESPDLFIENVGQFTADARFQLWGGRTTAWLAEDGIWITLLDTSPPSSALAPEGGVYLKLSFVGANPHPVLAPTGRQTTKVSYFRGGNPTEWHNAPVWRSVRYVDLYPGVDLVVGAKTESKQPAGLAMEAGALALPWRLETRTAADLRSVRLRLEGADAAELHGNRLRLRTAAGEQDLMLPPSELAYSVEAATTEGRLEVFEVSQNDGLTAGALPLAVAPAVDPPTLIYSTFLGGDQFDSSEAIAVDESGRATIAGGTLSSNFPTTPGAFDPMFSGNTDVFVARLNASGSVLEYATFIGGADLDAGLSLAVDGDGRAIVAGVTHSDDFPHTPGAFDPLANGENDAFVLRLSPSGSALEFATFLGGAQNDYARSISLDATGRVVVAGLTDSDGFPTTPGAYDSSYNGSTDGFVAILEASGAGLAYSSFLGGSGSDAVYGTALDTMGRVYITGETDSDDFPRTARFGPDQAAGDVFAAKMDISAATLDYSVLLTGSDEDHGRAIDVDSSGRACITGFSQSDDFPSTPGAYDPTFNGAQNYEPDPIVACLNASGSALEYSTFLGGQDEDAGQDLVLDHEGQAFVTGYTRSPALNNRATFITGLNASGNGLVYDVRLAGNDDDDGRSLALDGAGSVFVTGRTQSSAFPVTTGAFDTSFNGLLDAFASKLELPPPPSTPTASPTTTATPTPSATPTPTGTPIATLTPTPTVTATVSPPRARRYLPLLFHSN